MAKKLDTATDSTTNTSTEATAVAQADSVVPQNPPRLHDLITVQVAEGLSLINNETGQDFAPGVPTLQTVTVTTLRRLQDGDLVQARAV